MLKYYSSQYYVDRELQKQLNRATRNICAAMLFFLLWKLVSNVTIFTVFHTAWLLDRILGLVSSSHSCSPLLIFFLTFRLFSWLFEMYLVLSLGPIKCWQMGRSLSAEAKSTAEQISSAPNSANHIVQTFCFLIQIQISISDIWKVHIMRYNLKIAVCNYSFPATFINCVCGCQTP